MSKHKLASTFITDLVSREGMQSEREQFENVLMQKPPSAGGGFRICFDSNRETVLPSSCASARFLPFLPSYSSS